MPWTLFLCAKSRACTAVTRRVDVGIHAGIPAGIWLALYALVIFSLVAVGYHAGIAGSRRSSMMLVLALSFSLVITLIAALDLTQGGYFPVSQQPLADLRIVMAGREGRSPE